jgi:hypothetical protein
MGDGDIAQGEACREERLHRADANLLQAIVTEGCKHEGADLLVGEFEIGEEREQRHRITQVPHDD